ncbi:MAG: hypothetical protein WGN25_08780 [Candidatus Electrothrix sp. GW3-4]|uniref:hypothetical protein n=1 Tax=Candidatus Electrothrix sp. GW3-4 TaxID=3126740 RepID=UPI0030D39483
MKTEKVYSIHFDFRQKEQKRILEYMQQRGYKLLGFKGAEGDGQVAGIPVWFSVPYIRMAGEVRNVYQSLYKVYYVDSSTASDKAIRMTALSEVVELGSKVTLQKDGHFTVEPGGPENAILFINNRAVDSGTITVGLASLINGSYAPFCAFKAVPQKPLHMAPNDKICLFAVPTVTRAGSVAAQAVTEGALFELDAPHNCLHLKMKQEGDGFNPVSWGMPVREVHPGDPLTQLMDCHH